MKNYNYIYVIVIFCCLTHLGYSQSESETLIGKKVPDLAFEPIMNHKKQKAKLSDFSGKVVILDFWATWCGGCIKAFPHLEALKEKFSEDIEILTITSFDSKERIEQFLSKNKTTLPIVLDTAKVLKKQFPHRILSHTVVIDANRINRVISSPENITADVIQSILDHKEVNLKEKKYDFAWSREDHLSPEDALFQFTLTSFKGGSGIMTAFENGRILLNGAGIRIMYEYANGFPSYTRTVLEVDNKAKYDPTINKVDRYSLEIIAPNKTEDEVRLIMLDFLHRTLPLKSKVERRKVLVKVLQRTSGPSKVEEAVPGSKEEFWYSGSGVHLKNGPIDNRFTRFFENKLSKRDQISVVVNETGLSGKYNIDIPWYPEDPGNIHKELRKLGLELVDAEREIDLLILYEEPNATGFN